MSDREKRLERALRSVLPLVEHWIRDSDDSTEGISHWRRKLSEAHEALADDAAGGDSFKMVHIDHNGHRACPYCGAHTLLGNDGRTAKCVNCGEWCMLRPDTPPQHREALESDLDLLYTGARVHRDPQAFQQIADAYHRVRRHLTAPPTVPEALEWGRTRTGHIFVGHNPRSEEGGFHVISWAPDWINVGAMTQQLEDDSVGSGPKIPEQHDLAQHSEPDVLTNERSAIESSIRFVHERVKPLRCDNEAVSACVRCQTVYLADVLDRALAQHSEPGQGECGWSLDDEGYYQTDCGTEFVPPECMSLEELPTVKYCANCGRRIRDDSPAPDADERED